MQNEESVLQKNRIYDIGLIDPYYIHEKCVKRYPDDTQDYLVKALRFNKTKRKILFPYNFQ